MTAMISCGPAASPLNVYVESPVPMWTVFFEFGGIACAVGARNRVEEKMEVTRAFDLRPIGLGDGHALLGQNDGDVVARRISLGRRNDADGGGGRGGGRCGRRCSGSGGGRRVGGFVLGAGACGYRGEREHCDDD